MIIKNSFYSPGTDHHCLIKKKVVKKWVFAFSRSDCLTISPRRSLLIRWICQTLPSLLAQNEPRPGSWIAHAYLIKRLQSLYENFKTGFNCISQIWHPRFFFSFFLRLQNSLLHCLVNIIKRNSNNIFSYYYFEIWRVSQEKLIELQENKSVYFFKTLL